MKLSASPTGVGKFLRCEGLWYTPSVLKVYRYRGLPGEHRDRGKAFHELLAHGFRVYAETGRTDAFEGTAGHLAAETIFQKLYDDEGTALSEEVCEDLLGAIRYHFPRLGVEQWEILEYDGEPLIERSLHTEFAGVDLRAIVDLVFRHRRTGKLWVVDWKTTVQQLVRAGLPKYVEHDYQLFIQRMVVGAALGVRPDVTALCVLRSVSPKPPELTKRGKVTRDKSRLACDWDTYTMTLLENGEDPDEESAQEVRAYLAETTFVHWKPDITTDVGDRAMRQRLAQVCRRMQQLASGEAEPLLLLNHHSRGNCNSCDYDRWCTARMRNGGEPDLTQLGLNYRVKEGSPLKAPESVPLLDTKPDPYVAFATRHGRTLEPHEEFTP